MIHRLPDDLVNKIAAGEVVERPSSVVKELVENALDAGAKGIAIEIQAGGKSLIRVRDDGSGMTRADAALSVERHATSKLDTFEDLKGVTTHGFRGEALPSIASVSELRLVTREEQEEAGTEVAVRHGRAAQVKDAGHPRGTTVEIRDLFFEVPARRKFLRADATEAAHVAEAVALLALGRPDVSFALTSGSQRTIEAPVVDSVEARLYQLHGARTLDRLAKVEGEEAWARVTGFASTGEGATTGRGQIRLFVNGRPIRDRAVSKAVLEAYRRAGVRDPRPEAFLFLSVPPAMVDVNVHPAKTEVRFADSRTMFSLVERSVREALSRSAHKALERTGEGVRESAERYLEAHKGGEGVPPAFDTRFGATGGPERVEEARELFHSEVPTVLGQHRNTYIVATNGEDILLVDQHTAQERVLYERIRQRRLGSDVESQLLLSPVVVELSPDVLPLLEEHASVVRALGFDAEVFGKGTVRLRAVPALLGAREPGAALEAILRDATEREDTQWAVAGIDERLAATLACHAAVRAGEPLGIPQMAAIVRDLGETEHPGLCPHGRPTSVKIEQAEVARWFGRSGWRRQ